MTNDDIIELAEFCGRKAYKTTYRDIRHQQMVSCGEEEAPIPRFAFSPHTDANDCEALIRALNERNIQVIVNWHTNGPGVSMRNWKTNEIVGHWYGGVSSTGRDNYKQGVCELALKVAACEEKDND